MREIWEGNGGIIEKWVEVCATEKRDKGGKQTTEAKRRLGRLGREGKAMG